MLRLLETSPAPAVEAAVAVALARDSPRLETVRLLLRQQGGGPPARGPARCSPSGRIRARIAVSGPDVGRR